MDRNQFQSAADELLDPVPEAAPDRPREDNYAQLRQEREGYGHGSMASQQPAAILTNNRVNSAYFEHAAQAGTERQDSREAVEQAQNRGPDQPAEQTNEQKLDREAKEPVAPENQQSQQQEFDWNRYTQDRDYANVVDDLLSKQQGQQNINSRKR